MAKNDAKKKIKLGRGSKNSFPAHSAASNGQLLIATDEKALYHDLSAQRIELYDDRPNKVKFGDKTEQSIGGKTLNLGELAEKNKVTDADIEDNTIAQGKIKDLTTDLGKKVDKVDGKGLSTNDFDTEAKNKLTDIDAGAQVNVQSDYTETDDTKDSFIKNKPTLGALAAKDKIKDADVDDAAAISQSKIANLTTDLGKKVDKLETKPTAGTYTKVAVNAEGQVTAGEALAASDMPEGIAQSKISNLTTDLSGKLDKVTGTTSKDQIYVKKADGTQGMMDVPEGAVYDDAMSDTSTNAVQNKVIKKYVDDADALKVTKNADITAGTHTKITYDAKGLVTGGENLVKGDIPTIDQDQVDGLGTALGNKVDKVDGSRLMTEAEGTKLTGIADGATKVESSATNGNIKINGTETTVYNDTAVITRINNLESVGRFLSMWNGTTGLPATNPPGASGSSYTYHSGDYYRVASVASPLEDTLIPNGSAYVIDTASTTKLGTGKELAVGDIFYYDGSNWAIQAVAESEGVSDVTIDGTTCVELGIAKLKKLAGKDEVAEADLATALANKINGKVDKVDGKGLSEKDFTATFETKLNGIAEGAEVNVQSDWDVTEETSDAFILHKPTLGSLAAKSSIANTDVADNAAIEQSKIANLTTDLGNKVAKETGKSLVSDTEITKLAGVSAGANKVEASANGKIKIDGTDTDVYTLPVGAAAALGGVMGAAKEANDTQEVHIDTATGKMYTKPGEVLNNDNNSLDINHETHIAKVKVSAGANQALSVASDGLYVEELCWEDYD